MIHELDCMTSVPNQAGKKPIDVAEQIKDHEVRATMKGLLNKIHTSTKVVRNTEIKREKYEDAKRLSEKSQRLRDDLKACLEE